MNRILLQLFAGTVIALIGLVAVYVCRDDLRARRLTWRLAVILVLAMALAYVLGAVLGVL